MFARSYRIGAATFAAGLVSLLALTACGDPGSSGTEAPPTAGPSAGPGCEPIASEDLVLLADDKNLQSSDNIIAAINAQASTPALKTAVDKVADALDQPKLLALNKAVEIDRQSSQEAATAFAAANGLTSGLSGGSGSVVVGAANFPESMTLAELYKIALNAAGFQATVQQSTNREVYEPALERGEITVFPEYAATITEFLNKKANGANAASEGEHRRQRHGGRAHRTRQQVRPDLRQAVEGHRPERVRGYQAGSGQVRPEDALRLRGTSATARRRYSPVHRSARPARSARSASRTPTASPSAPSCRQTPADRRPRPRCAPARPPSGWSSRRTARSPRRDVSEGTLLKRLGS